MGVFCLGSEQIDRFWYEILPHLERLEENGDILASEVKEALKRAEMQLWGYQDGRMVGVCITQVTKSKVLWIYGAAGTETAKGQILAVHSAIEAWAREQGLRKLKLQGRKGWLRILEGYAQTGIVLEKEL